MPNLLDNAMQLLSHISGFISKRIQKEKEKSAEKDNEKEIINMHRKSKNAFKFINNNSFLKYSYESVRVRGVRYRNLNLSDIQLDKEVIFVPEPDNPYDSNAVKIVYKGDNSDIFIGYIPRNRLQFMVLDFLKCDDKMVQGFVSKVDEEEKEIFICMAFYEKMSEENLKLLSYLDTTLVKTSKKDYMGVPRKENLEFVDKDDSVEINYDIDLQTYIVVNHCGEEIGEINKNAAKELQEFENNGKNLYAFIFDIKELSLEKNKYIVRIIAR